MNNKRVFRFGIYFLVFLVWISSPCFALKTLLIENGYVYEMYGSQEDIPLAVLQEAEAMYFESYLYPRLHEGLSLQTLQLEDSGFVSYEEFIQDMFHRDFISYQFADTISRLYLQARKEQEGKVVGVCVVLLQADDCYYIDHIGVDGPSGIFMGKALILRNESR